MKLIPQYKLNKSLEKPLLKYRPLRSEIDLFKTELINVLDHLDNSETEEFHKNLVSNFLSKAFYTNTHFINTKGRQDLVIHTGKDNKTKVGVIIEAKRPTNKADWFTPDKPNSKALQELVLYYLRERIEESNIDIKYLIATNINEWYVIEAKYFDNLFFKNKQLVKHYEEWRDGKKVTKDTGLFYNDIAKPFIDSLTDEVPCIYFNITEHEKALRDKEDYNNKEVNALFKILSPFHLLKVPFANDSNELDERFYEELLHIIGLEEVKEHGKNIIRRKAKNRNNGSLLEKAIDELKTEGLHKISDLKSFGDTGEEQYFSIALELCITWINRILFLKLLEGQLINYHKGDQQYRFLNNNFINDFDELFKLFHKVLAVDIPNRNATIKQKYSRVPYLNSSLFEISDLEDVTIKINSIDSNDTLEFFGGTILKDQKKKKEQLNTLNYLFQFLDAYDFASEGTGDTQEDNKTLINASVLGKVFEKINGYKDGSYYTPGFITMYMSRQSIRLAVVKKFNDVNGWDCKEFADLDNYIEYQVPEVRDKANKLINDLKLCDPAVGSGHFLVSALNEIIAIKSDLKILQDVNGKRLKEYTIDVVNDELIITDEDNDLFVYNPQSNQSQTVQQTLFSEKQTIIENCLFGVDINPNSVKICRLRLWIELLKNAYYKQDGNLETLPNIDINIKCGNSLLSRFALDADLSKALKSIKYDVNAYRGFVNDYKNCKDREIKRGLQSIIDRIKADFRMEISKNDPLLMKLNKSTGDLYNLVSQVKIFEDDAKTKKLNKLKKEKLETDIEKWTNDIDEIKNNAVYKNAFEWRFEFPEVLNNDGDFVGFNVVLGNPPWGVELNEAAKNILSNKYPLVKTKTKDTYLYFLFLSFNISVKNSLIGLVIPNTWLLINNASEIRNHLLNYSVKEIIDYGDNIFQGAIVETSSLILENQLIDLKSCVVKRYKKGKEIINNDAFNVELWKSDTLKRFVIDLDSDYELVNSKVGQLSKPFDECCDIIFGIKPYQLGHGKPPQTAEIIKERRYHSDVQIDNSWKPLLVGQNINRYTLENPGNQYIKYGDWLMYKSNEERMLKPKLFLRRTSDTIRSCYDESGFYGQNSLFVINSQLVDLKLLMSILNSSLMNYIYQKRCPQVGKIFAEIKPSIIKELPLMIEGDKVVEKKIIALAEKILEEKKVNISNNTSQLEKQLDILVYQLYNLTEIEITIVENGTKQISPESKLLVSN